MKLIIEIDERYYEIVKREVEAKRWDFIPCTLIANGIPLPKGHGRLIDADELKADCYSIVDPKGIYSELKIIEDYYIDNAPTIIEADGGRTE